MQTKPPIRRVMKRKREVDSEEIQLSTQLSPAPLTRKTSSAPSLGAWPLSPEPLPLTQRNLSLLQASEGTNLEARTTMSGSSSAISKKTTSSSDQHDKSTQILNVWRIFIDNPNAQPSAPLMNLTTRICKPREGQDVTPNSQRIAQIQKAIRAYTERNALAELLALLSYKHKIFKTDTEGEEMVYVSQDDQWADCIPVPDGCNQKTLEDAMSNLGCPKKPKPDVAHGYHDYVFDDDPDLKARRDSLPTHAQVLRRMPYWPWLIFEVKTKQPILVAEKQAARDAAAAISALHETILHLTGVLPPPHATAVFSLAMDAEVYKLRIHWRQIDGQGRVSFESSRIDRGLLEEGESVYQLRGKLFNILRWAQTSRWHMVRTALATGQFANPLACAHDEDHETQVDETHVNGLQPRLPTPPSSTGTFDAPARHKRRKMARDEPFNLQTQP